MSAADKLSDKHKKFADELILNKFNQTKAAIKAGYAKSHARITGSKLLTNPNIQAYLNERKAKLAKKMEISQEKTLTEMGRLSYSDIRKLFNQNGTVKAIHEIDDDTAAAISSIEVEEKVVKGKKQGRITKIRFWSKDKPLEMLGKHFKIYEDITPIVIRDEMDITKLSATELKTLLQLKQKMAK